MFDYLKKYIIDVNNKEKKRFNNFYFVSQEEITETENRLSYPLPEQLKIFYKEIGYGFLQAPHVIPKGYSFFNANSMHHPDTLADIVLLGGDGDACPYISPYTWEQLEPGYLPFFEIGDSNSFLVMKALSDNPNAVWDDFGSTKIEDSLERFIWRMYYEDPIYYGDIIQDSYDKKST